MRQEGITQKAIVTVRLALVVVSLVLIAISYLMLHYHRGTADFIEQLFYGYKYYRESKIAGWHTIDLRAFAVDTPKEYLYESIQGIDSFVGRITNSRDTLIFDYGLYSYDFSDINTLSYTKTEVVINGKRAYIIQPKQLERGMVGVYFPQVVGQNRFCLVGNSSEKRATLIKMYQSIVFKNDKE